MHLQSSLRSRRLLTLMFIAVAVFCGSMMGLKAQQSSAAETKDQPYAIEYYYKAKWGHAEEFLALFKKNHYPVLKKEMELGRMLKMSMVTPRSSTPSNSAKTNTAPSRPCSRKPPPFPGATKFCRPAANRPALMAISSEVSKAKADSSSLRFRTASFDECFNKDVKLPPAL